MPATYTFDVYCSLDGFGSFSGGDWGGYWGKQGPELLEHRAAVLREPHRAVLGGTTYREFVAMLGPVPAESPLADPVNTLMLSAPMTVVSDSLEEPLAWPNAQVARGGAVDVVARLKAASDLPLRSHGSLSMNRALMAAGLVDQVQVTIFPVITGRTGTEPVFGGAADFDLDLVSSRTFDGRTQELVYRPTLHT